MMKPLERSEDLIAEQMADALEGRPVIRDALIVINAAGLAMCRDMGGYVSFYSNLCIPKKMYLADITENPAGGGWYWITYPNTTRTVTGHKLRKLRKMLNPPKK